MGEEEGGEVGGGLMDQTDSLMVLILAKATVIPCCHLDLGPIPDL